MDREVYDWAAYYRRAYEREKKNAARLTARLYEAQNKREELSEKYRRITGSFAWKVLAPARLAGRVLRKLKSGMGAGAGSVDGRKTVDSTGQDAAVYRAYQQELERQMDPYGEWIRLIEPGLRESFLRECSVTDREAQELCVVKAYADMAGIRSMEELWEHGREPELLLLAEHPGCLDLHAARLALAALRTQKDAVFWYGDEDHADEAGRRSAPYFKPEWSPDTLLGFFYFGSYVGIRVSRAKDLQLRGDRDGRRNLYDLCLQLAFTGSACTDSARTGSACRTPLVLYTGRIGQEAGRADSADSGETVLETTVSEDYRRYGNYWGYEQTYTDGKLAALAGLGFEGKAFPTCEQGVWSVVPVISNEPLVSVVIPSKDNYEVLKNCICSFVQKTDYANVEFLIVDNGSSAENRRKVEQFLKNIQRSSKVYGAKYLYEQAPFNFSHMCNCGAQAAEGEYILLLNDDIEIVEENWLKILVGQALLPGTGAVGAKLWYPECERIQHAGITNLAIGPSHKLITFPDDRLYYYGHGAVIMDMIGVTAACLLIRKQIYDELGGLQEEMTVAYNDVEFCFRLYRHGYRNVQRNDAVLWHHESLSRGKDDQSDEKWKRLLSEKARLYAMYPERRENDPYYSAYLTQNSPEYVTGYAYPYEDRLLVCEFCGKETAGAVKRWENGALRLALDRVLIQRKFHEEEPDILFAEGWCYLAGADNAMFSRAFVLLAENGEVLLYSVHDRYRYDVCSILPGEMNIGLAGFTCRIAKAGLRPGRYRTGMLYQHKASGRRYYAGADAVINIE